jgi:hypothetical protein
MHALITHLDLPSAIAGSVTILGLLFAAYLVRDACRCRRRRRQISQWRREVTMVWMQRVNSGDWDRWLPLARRRPNSAKGWGNSEEWLY